MNIRLIVAAALLASAACAEEAKLRIAVIPIGTSHVFWKSVEAGARAAGQELGVDIAWKGPLNENERAQQIAIVEQFSTEGVSGIVLSPMDDTALVRPVAAARARQIPVVIFNSALKGEVGKDFISYVATNNRLGGQLGGDHLATLVGDTGNIVLLRYQVGTAGTMEREDGFLAAIRKHPGLVMSVDNRYGGATMATAKTASLNLIDKLREAQGVFCPNESSTFGMLLALRQCNLAGKIRFVGFDTSPPLIDALKKGEIDALVAQDPVKMGYLGVKTCVAHIRGQPVDANIDTGVRLITRASLEDPDVKKLLGL